MTIAQEIRNAAINWPQFLGDIESEIVYSFYGSMLFFPSNIDFDCRVFMLLVAEALE